jgi:hypothetical protein
MSVEVSRSGAAAGLRKGGAAERLEGDAATGGLIVSGLILVLIFLQKIVVPVSSTVPLSVPLIAVYGAIAVMAVRLQLRIAPARMAAFGLMMCGMFVSQLTAIGNPSPLSMLQVLILYLPLIFVWQVTEARYLKTINVFQNAMIVCGAVVWIQLGSQVVFGMGNTPNMDLYVPSNFLLPGYNYHAPNHWGEAFVRPNGFFFLEPSFISSFLSAALITEIMFFRRLWRMAFYAAALLGTVALTGIVVFVFALPFLIRRLPPKMLMAAGVLAALALVVASSAGLLNSFFGRFSELSSPNSSGFERIVSPIIKLGRVMEDPRFIFSGTGAGGNVEKGSSTWPMVKVATEYGVISALCFLALVITTSVKSPNRALAFGFLMVFNFTGGYLVAPPSVIELWLLIAMMTPIPPARGTSLLAPPVWEIGVKRERREKRTDGGLVEPTTT